MSGAFDDIVKLRELHKPVVVRLHHVPKWFKQKLMLWLRLHDRAGAVSALDPLHAFTAATGWRVDHSGSSEKSAVFVNEPYAYADEDVAAENARIAEMLHCDFCESQNSYWYPGRTKRYEFRRKQ